MLTLNTGSSVFKAICAIAATSSKLEKDALLKAAGSSSTLFMKVVTAAYDPFKNYGISNAPNKAPGAAPGGNTLDEALPWKILNDLATRNLSGNSARETVQNMVNLLDDSGAELFRRIINKDMRAGFSEGTINRCFKGTIAEFPYMRCSLPAKSNMPKWDWGVGIIVQEKADGMFANVNLDEKGFLWVTSRAGSPFPEFSLGIEQDMLRTLAPDTQTHGEFTVFENGVLMPRAEGNGVMNSLLQGGQLEAHQRVVFEAWDQIPLSAVAPKGKFLTPYKTRFVALARQCLGAQRAGISSVRSIPTRVVKTKAEAYAYYRELLKKGKEGVVCKHPDAWWADNTSKDQVKLKLTFEVELRVIGFVEGKPGSKTEATFGALLCRSECGLLKTGVGTGLTDALRLIDRDQWMNSIITVKANDIAAPDDEGDDLYSLFLPVYVDTRLDKMAADTLEQIHEQRKAAIEAA